MKRRRIMIGVILAAGILATACGSKTADTKSTNKSLQNTKTEDTNKTASQQSADNGNVSTSSDSTQTNSQTENNSTQNTGTSQTATNANNNNNDSGKASESTKTEITSKDAIEKVKGILGTIPSGHYVTYDTDVTQDGKNYYVIHYYEVVVDNKSTGDSHTVTYGWYYVDKSNGDVYSMDQTTGNIQKIK